MPGRGGPSRFAFACSYFGPSALGFSHISAIVAPSRISGSGARALTRSFICSIEETKHWTRRHQDDTFKRRSSDISELSVTTRCLSERAKAGRACLSEQALAGRALRLDDGAARPAEGAARLLVGQRARRGVRGSHT